MQRNMLPVIYVVVVDDYLAPVSNQDIYIHHIDQPLPLTCILSAGPVSRIKPKHTLALWMYSRVNTDM